MELKDRAQVAKKDTWATTDLYETDCAWEESLEKAKGFSKRLLEFKGRLGSSAGELLEYYQTCDEMDLLTDRLGHYAMRKKDEDTTNAIYQAMEGKIRSLFVELSGAMAFEEPELLAIPDVILKRFYEEKPDLLLYQRHIDKKRRKKAHILSEAQEKIMAAAKDLCSAPTSIYGMLNDADYEFPTIIDEEGNEVRLSQGNFIKYLESPDRRVRKDAFEKFYSVYEQFKNTSAALLNAQMKQLQFVAKMRNYNSTIEAALDQTEVPVAVYHSLLKAVEKKLPSMHQYVKLRKKALHVEELHMYDLYTPIVPDMDIKISFEEAKETILKALAPMGEEYISLLKKGFNDRWIDVYENKGKRSGAYSAGAKVHPYVLLNYADTLDSMFTLAHEMGHALHSYYSNKNQPNVYSDYVIFVAEVASTCNEALLMKYLLQTTKDKVKRAYLVNHYLEKFRGTLFRQTMFAEFELLVNEMVAEQKPLTAKALNECYHELNVKYYGDSITVDSQIDVEWARIPHFYYNYYVFQYATGYSAAIALSSKILKEGLPAVENYKKFLSGGCSTDPISLLKIAGVDMSTPEPVEQALDLFESLIKELEELL